MICANATGMDKLVFMFIGRSNRPQCYGRNWEPVAHTGVMYYGNDTADSPC
jgi:hypothetical protein